MSVCVCVPVLCPINNGTYVSISVVPVSSTMHALTTKSDFSCYFVFRSRRLKLSYSVLSNLSRMTMLCSLTSIKT